MAISTHLGGIAVNDHQFSTVLTAQMLLEMTIPGMAFEPLEATGDQFTQFSERVEQLAPARGLAQRNFYNPGLRYKAVKDLETGERKREQVRTFVPTAKLRNSKGDLHKYVKGPYIDAPKHDSAAMPAFVLFYPEHLDSTRLDFDAGMSGEYYSYDLTGVGKAMILDGESRAYAIEKALSDSGVTAISGPRKEILREKLVTVEIHHGLSPLSMGQVFADLNGKGVKLNSNEAASRDVRDPWAKATREVFDELGVPLQASGRQITAASRAEGKHLMFNHARAMVRALGTGSVGGATSTSPKTSGIDFDRVTKTSVEWFGIVLDHFEGADVFSDPGMVVRAMPVKVALGLMGNAWYDTDLAARKTHLNSLNTINWEVSPAWSGIAGKVQEGNDGVPTLAASGAKEIGAKAATALRRPDSVPGQLIREQ